MIYGRYNELDSYGIHGIYKPTNITGGPHPFFLAGKFLYWGGRLDTQWQKPQQIGVIIGYGQLLAIM
jgi:hypothetical protein